MTNHTVCQQSIRSRYEEKHPKRCEADSLHPQESKLNLLLHSDVVCSVLSFTYRT